MMHTTRALVGLLLVQLLLAGCGRDDSGGSANSSEASTPSVSQPLQGRAPSKASQFIGTWMFATEGDYIGFEFMKDSKVLVTHALSGLAGQGAGTMMTYSLLDGGRLSLTALTGQTQVFEVTLSGEEMELKGGQVFSDGSQRFRRLRAGQTLAQAVQEREQAEAKAYQERVAALVKLFQQPNLVLAFTETVPPARGSIALDIQAGSAGFTGKAWHDDIPPRLNAISGQFSLDENVKRAEVIVTFGQRIGPPATQPDAGGRIAMSVTGDAKSLRVSSQVSYGSGATYEMVLRSDPKLHSQIVKRYEGELARIESLKRPMIDLLKDYAVLHGQLSSPDQRRTEPDTIELTLVRDPQSGQYRGEGVLVGVRGRGELVAQAGAEIAVVNDRPVLRIVSSTRHYLLRLPDPKAATLSGQWTTGGYGQGHGAQFDIVESLDAKTRDAKFEARRKALKSLGANTVLIGLAHEGSASGMDMPIPVRLQITVNPDGAAAGKAEYPSVSTLLTVGGQITETPVGPRLQLRFTAAESTPRDQIFFRSIQNGVWNLIPAGDAAPRKLTGYFTGPPLRVATLTLANEESLAHLRKKLAEAMGEDGQFLAARFVGWQRTIGWPAGVVPTVVKWKLDEASNEITGGIVVDGQALGTNPKAVTTYEGRVGRENEWITLELMQIMPWGRNKSVSAIKLFVCEDADGLLHLNGAMAGLPTIPLEQPLPAFPVQLDRLVEFLPVTSTDAQTRAAVARAIADEEKSQADAKAAQLAQQQADLAARRAKMTPFFLLFQAQTGLVITTDAPAEMGSVLLIAQVDEEKATISGRGIDLRQMPFREFGYECDLDNRDNLTITTTISQTPYVFTNPTEKGASGRSMTLSLLSEPDRARLDALISLGARLQNAAQAVLTVETLDAATAKTREANLQAGSLPGVAIYRDRKNDQIAAMFTVQSNRRYTWAKEPIALRLNEPVTGTALYVKGSGPTNDLTVVINGVHRAVIDAIPQLGAAIVKLPPDLEILDIRLEAGGTAQARGIVLVD